MYTVIWNRNRFLKTLFACSATASFLLWLIYLLLAQANFGLPVECFFAAQICVVLLTAPYLAAYTCHTSFLKACSAELSAGTNASLLSLSPISFGWQLLRMLLVSQVPLLYWILLSAAGAFFIMDASFAKVLQMSFILAVYSVSAAAVGVWAAQVFQAPIFGAECATLLWCVLIGGAFLLNPLGRYVDNLQPFLLPVLHLNPIIAVCCIFEGLDIFRNPLIYELTPVPSYIFMYPKPWYLVGVWQLVIGSCCFLGAWRICVSRGNPD